MRGANRKRWAQRVAAWRASGLTSEAFSRGREFTAGGLRFWAHRLRQQRRPRRTPSTAPAAARTPTATRTPPPVRLVRVAVGRPAAMAPSPPRDDAPAEVDAPSGVVLQVGTVRIGLAVRFDRAVLAAVLAIVGSGGGR